MGRTKEEIAANEMDRRLFNLIGDAERQTKLVGGPHWNLIAQELREARGRLRALMSEEDRRDTM